MTPVTPGAQVDPKVLREYMIKHFSESDLETLCFDLSLSLQQQGLLAEGNQVTLETVGGGSKPAKVLNLIQYLMRRGWFDSLVAEVRRTEQAKTNPI